MTDLRTDDVLRRYFVAAATNRPPSDLLSRSLSRTVAAPQNRSWRAGLPHPLRRVGRSSTTMRFVYAGLVAVAMLGALVLGGALSPPPTESPSPSSHATTTPTASVTVFYPTFEYTMPEPPLTSPGASSTFVEWFDGAGRKTSHHGVAIVNIEEAFFHACPAGDRLRLPVAPAAVLATLESEADLGVGPVSATTVDGWPGVTARILPKDPACQATGVHHGEGLVFDDTTLGAPSQLIVAEVMGRTILIKIWARTEGDLDAWLPAAREFVASFRFTQAPGRSTDPSSDRGTSRVQSFIRPFDWTPMDPSSDHVIVPYHGVMDREVFHWLDNTGDDGHAVQLNESQLAGKYGVAIAEAGKARPDACPDDSPPVFLRQSPENLLFDLRSIGGVGLGPERAGELDGRPALIADLDPTHNLACASRLQVLNGQLGHTDVLLLTLPSRFIVADIDGETVIVQIWAHTADELTTWLPFATRFVDGIHFLPVPGSSPSVPVRVDDFSIPFDYTPMEGDQIAPARNLKGQEVYHWVHDPDRVDSSTNRNGAQEFGGWGISIGWGGRASMAPCHGSSPALGTDPADVLADIRTVVSGVGPERATTLDGRPAVVADLDPSANGVGCDLRVLLNPVLGGGDYLALNLPSRLIVAKIDGSIVIVQIWAPSLDAWLPAAGRFVEDIHFIR